MGNKQNITISVDYGLSDKLKKQGLNISEVCNNAMHAAVVEERIKEQVNERQVEDFKSECGYLPVYDKYTAASLRIFRESKIVLKKNVVDIQKEYPEWNNPDGLIKYLEKKFSE